jgi:signal transduction histidine kinase
MKETKERITVAIDRARTDLEDALYELEKLPTVSDDSIGFAAHALTNYLTVTSGTVALLKMALEDHPDLATHKLLDTLKRSTDLMTHTVGQLRSASIGRDSKVVFGKVDLSGALKLFTTFYQTVADPKQIRCIFEPEEDSVLAWTDKVMAAVVVDNLLSNAVKYSPRGSRIWIELRVEGDSVITSVRDEGPGMGREDLARLFQRGTRLTPQPTAGEPSTGYGLAVAQEFVHRLGGKIWCESTMGEGSCFFLRLPRYEESLHGAGA